VKQSNIAKLESTLLSVSSPKSSNYGKLWSLDEVNQLTAPAQADIDTVVSFLKEHGVNEWEFVSGFLRTTVPVEIAEKMLDTQYKEYIHNSDGHKVLRCSDYSLPEHVASVVDFVSPTVNFPATFSKPTAIQSDVAAAYQNTPTSLRTLYSVNATGSYNVKARQAVTAFLDEHYQESDLQTFYKEYFPSLYGTPLYQVIGPNSAPGTTEASLDVDYMSPLGAGVPTEFWSFAGSAPDNAENEPFLDWLYYLGNTTDAPYVFSTSYGEGEDTVSLDYATRINQEFAEQGLRGVSFLFSSGDSGVGGSGLKCNKFVPEFPTNSPYVTSVGGTTGLSPETTASLSGGGFSNRWPQQPWQVDAVKNFLATNTQLPAMSYYNTSGRAYPDVSGQATNYVVIAGGKTYASVAGTSCSSPTVGGIIGLLNNFRVAAGKSPLGFLNPFIYEYGDLFTDITSGNNPGCGTTGFYASSGWDPATGWGTPNFAKLVKAVLALP